jgi:hypothetical protein
MLSLLGAPVQPLTRSCQNERASSLVKLLSKKGTVDHIRFTGVGAAGRPERQLGRRVTRLSGEGAPGPLFQQR